MEEIEPLSKVAHGAVNGAHGEAIVPVVPEVRIEASPSNCVPRVSSPTKAPTHHHLDPVQDPDLSKKSIKLAIGQLLSRSSSSVSLTSVNSDHTAALKNLQNQGHQLITRVMDISPFHSRNSSNGSIVVDQEDKSPSHRRHTTAVPPFNGHHPVPVDEKDNLRSYTPDKVKETRHVYVDYDPISKRKVLNTYEILRDLGLGQHGKVKLARDTVTDRLVAIKIVDRNSKQRFGKLTKLGTSQEDKIRREIAIMKKCDHPHVVKLIEVLDDVTSRKIYLVLEYLEKGEIKWQHLDEVTHETRPVLKFHEAQKVFRDVVLGLEYLHYQGIIHRDIKPANLLVSADNVVKISDFGVSFASSLDYANNELELCKTAGTPAFLAPELCQTEVLSQEKELKVDHKIDIWALGVTLFCLLFDTLPFNSESEFKLFEVINNEPLKIPPKTTLADPEDVSDLEWDFTVDLLNKLLTKNLKHRIDIPEIKQHDFFLYGLSKVESQKYTTLNDNIKLHVSNEEVNYAVVGIGSKIKKKLVKALKLGFPNLEEDYESINSSQNSGSSSSKQSTTKLNDSSTKSLILSEALSTDSSTPTNAHSILKNHFNTERRGSADLIETKDVLEGSFKKSANEAIDKFQKLNTDSELDKNNTFVKQSRKSSVDHSFSVYDKPKMGNRTFNSSFASLDSFHDESNVVDFNTYVPVGYRGRFPSNAQSYRSRQDSSPQNYAPTTSSSLGTNKERRNSKFSSSSVSSGSSCGSDRESDDITTLNTLQNTKRQPLKSKFFSLHDSSDEEVKEDSSDDEDDDKELMFAFGPKHDDAPYLRHRVMSHESNIRSVLRPLSPIDVNSEYVIPASSSTVDIPEEFQNMMPELNLLKNRHGSSNLNPVHSSSLETLKKKPSLPKTSSERSTPLRKSSLQIVHPPFAAPDDKLKLENYKNHYKKEHHVIPFEKSHHLETGPKKNDGQEEETEPIHRNNSVTLGLLHTGHL